MVVPGTHSCSSLNGWRGKSNKKVYADRKLQKTSTSTLPPPSIIIDRQCPSDLDRELCQNGGRCVMRLEPTCICSKGWSGLRCMEKETDANYNVKRIQTQESTTSASTEAITPTPNAELELIKVPAVDCPSPWDKDYCLNGGTCRFLSHGIGFICLCDYPYIGIRCGEKGLDGNYNTLSRQRRDLLSGNLLTFILYSHYAIQF